LLRVFRLYGHRSWVSPSRGLRRLCGISRRVRLVLEVRVNHAEGAIFGRAVKGGADRLEVCANLGAGGGTTPTLGLVKAVHAAVPDAPLMVRQKDSLGA